MPTTLQVFSCIAHIDDAIEELAKAGTLKPGPIGQWSSGKTVAVVGRRKSRGRSMFTPEWSVRWATHGTDGIFSKGLSLDTRTDMVDRIMHLPICK